LFPLSGLSSPLLTIDGRRCIQAHVWHVRSINFWTCLIAVIFAATGSRLHADAAASDSDGYKTVKIGAGAKAISIRVQQQSDPLKNVSSSATPGKYQPERLFSGASSLANKSFPLSASSLSHQDADFANPERSTFITKSYVENPASFSVPNLNTKADFPIASAYSRQAEGFEKSYSTSTADAGRDHVAMLASSTTTTDQNRTALFTSSEKSEDLAAYPMADKQYLGPGAQHPPDGVVIKENVTISRMSDVPNRPLTIDEVRNLINHGAKPDTDAKPAEPSKPLNDPDYKPEPLRDTPSPGSDDDKNDPVPSPGTMAAPPAPENAEPLPQP
jgi:hypothetical protein